MLNKQIFLYLSISLLEFLLAFIITPLVVCFFIVLLIQLLAFNANLYNANLPALTYLPTYLLIYPFTYLFAYLFAYLLILGFVHPFISLAIWISFLNAFFFP